MCFISLPHGCSVTCQMSVIVQEVLRVFIIRIACLNIDYASQLVKPIVSWISNRLSEQSVLSDVEAYKVISKNSFNVVPFGSVPPTCSLLINMFCLPLLYCRLIVYLNFSLSYWSIQMRRYFFLLLN